MKINNPVWYETSYDGLAQDGQRMTLQGAVWKTLLLLCCLLAAGAFELRMSMSEGTDALLSRAATNGGIALALAGAMIKWKHASRFLSIPFGLHFGATLGGCFGMLYGTPGITLVFLATFVSAIFLPALLWTYWQGKHHHRRNARLWRSAAWITVPIVNLGMLLLLGKDIFDALQSGFKWQYLVVVLLYVVFQIALLFVAGENFVYDFDFVEHGAEIGAPKYMEWYGAFSIMVTFLMVYFALILIFLKKKEGRLRRPRRNLPSKPLATI
ncbi:Bax inhibitor-1/YccA family membrane protein [Gulbenkiania mobilis]|uniref:Bax inhibitor-1/YccA family membrane protein n=1 Tax=Gulbenkiania mobilis TaxID=397457 RepID=UPI0006BC09C0|nr:Bax inhibitor-1/YccA family protein [Gulbenkiania mobilis]